MKNKILTLLSLFLLTYQHYGQEHTIFLWDTIPNQIKNNEKELIKNKKNISISNVQKPSFDVFLAPKQLSNRKAVIIFPGGGYGNLAINYEGNDFAIWLNSKGINAFVLKYRLPNSKSIIKKHLAPIQDAQRAIRLIRYNADRWNIDKNKIGVLGFSAGGHLAATLGTQFNYASYKKMDKADHLSARPDFMALIYPVISMDNTITHEGSKFNLLGKQPSKKLVRQFSNELQVKHNTPPAFVLHCIDDTVVPVENSIRFFEAFQKNNLQIELHIYPKGGHGFAFSKNNKRLENWIKLLNIWLSQH